MTDIREYLAHKPLLFDGGMGTYYKAAPGVECELANLTDPEGVKRVPSLRDGPPLRCRGAEGAGLHHHPYPAPQRELRPR